MSFKCFGGGVGFGGNFNGIMSNAVPGRQYFTLRRSESTSSFPLTIPARPYQSSSRAMSIFGASIGTSVYGGSFNAITNTTYATRPSGKLMTIDRIISYL